MKTQLQTIPFYNRTLTTFEQNNTHYVAMRPICENIGLAWSSQLQRIKRDDVLNSTVFIINTVGNDEKDREMVCLPIQYLNGWLFGIDTNRVKPEIRERLITYKRECYQALHDYWNKGKAERSQPQPVIISMERELLNTLYYLLVFAVDYSEKALPKFKSCRELFRNAEFNELIRVCEMFLTDDTRETLIKTKTILSPSFKTVVAQQAEVRLPTPPNRRVTLPPDVIGFRSEEWLRVSEASRYLTKKSRVMTEKFYQKLFARFGFPSLCRMPKSKYGKVMDFLRAEIKKVLKNPYYKPFNMR
ncbi:phage antirepressor N-terminal domain-containing protein [Avibacterium sp. 20-15]|uniref:phage antirepressor N-terminal domain-containing protein n=1 Tax=unclassified Avibacterium TaxID=2685287 RepID=UPI00202617E4|nr:MULTISPECIES: phage antirepressor N-terminal domain-containing protein [unclassified Avibacterium]MCW9733741.1 phage antirepressor N-terminal domain-containing protein [Avibacterium sp. 20-15]URL03590.1 phage antirepressor N-terminal domain-containing protein [Avibacterium sp. 20-132]